MVREGLRRTGYDEVALTSLSSADFSGIDGVVADLVNDQVGTGSVSVSLPSLRVDAFSVGIASEIQKVRRTGLTFAPEAGSWRLRQVINKLILEDDLYSRGRRGLLAGLAAGEALLPHRPADRDGRRHARHRRAREERRRHRPQATPSRRAAPCRSAVSCRSRTRRSSGSARTASTSCAARSSCCATRCKGTRAQVKWHDPAATFAEGIASRGDRRIGRVIERVWRAGGTFQEWSEHFRLDRWLDAMQAEGLDPDWYVTRHRTARRGAAVGSHHRRSAQGLPLAGLAGGPGRARAPRLPVDAVLRLRGVHRLRPRARGGLAGRPGGRQPGHRPGPGRREAASRCASSAPNRAVGAGCGATPAFPVRLRYTKRGKVRWISHRDVARALERAFRITELPLAFSEGFSPRPEGELRPRALDRARERRRVPRPRVRPTRSTSTRCRSCSPRRSPKAWPSSAPNRSWSGRRRCKKPSPRWSGASSVVNGDGAPVAASELRSRIEVALDAAGASDRRGGARAVRSTKTYVRSSASTSSSPTRTNPVSIEMELIHATTQREARRGARRDRTRDRRCPAGSSKRGRCVRTNGSSATARGRNRSMPTRARVRGGARVMREGIDVRVRAPRRHGDDDRITDAASSRGAEAAAATDIAPDAGRHRSRREQRGHRRRGARAGCRSETTRTARPKKRRRRGSRGGRGRKKPGRPGPNAGEGADARRGLGRRRRRATGTSTRPIRRASAAAARTGPTRRPIAASPPTTSATTRAKTPGSPTRDGDERPAIGDSRPAPAATAAVGDSRRPERRPRTRLTTGRRRRRTEEAAPPPRWRGEAASEGGGSGTATATAPRAARVGQCAVDRSVPQARDVRRRGRRGHRRRRRRHRDRSTRSTRRRWSAGGARAARAVPPVAT